MLRSGRVSLAYRKPHTCRQHRSAFTGGVNSSAPVRTGARRAPNALGAGLLVVVAAVVGALGYEALAASSSPTAPIAAERLAPRPRDTLHGDHPGALGEADGAVPDGTTVFDDEIPGVAKLDPVLLGALRQAATDAVGDGVVFYVNSGWRSPAYEEQLRREAVSKYGSEAEAARWVATPDTSAHVSGDAVDVGHSDAMAWLSEHGAEYGLCQIYGNEPWHFELRPVSIDHGCPTVYTDPTHDPRMQR